MNAEKDIITVLTFVSFFPCISSGPIQRAKELIPMIKNPKEFDYEQVTDGLKLMAWGFFKKLVIADNLAAYISGVRETDNTPYGLAVLLAAIIYSFQLYMDFSGYSDIAIGSAKALGFDLKKNFDHPYLSGSVGEFWRRWHISLSGWLRDYVYIPLGGNRKGDFRKNLNLLITFAISGLWHGAGITWIIWGVYHGICLCMENILKKRAGIKRIGIIPTFLVVSFGWMIFAAPDMGHFAKELALIGNIPNEIMNTIPELAAANGSVFGALGTVFMLGSEFNVHVSFIALLAYLGISIYTFSHDGLTVIRRQKSFVRWILYFALLLCVMFFSAESSGEFIYNRF